MNVLEAGIGPHVDDPEILPEVGGWAPDEDEEDEAELPRAYDEYTGNRLDGALVVKARADEVAGLKQLGTWVERPISESFDKTGKAPIQGRWVECNKGDDENPDVRSRAVVCETKRVSNIAPDDINSVFSATPPLEAIRAQCSLMMSLKPVDGEPILLQFLDISKAHLHCPVLRDNVYVRLPKEFGIAAGMSARC